MDESIKEWVLDETVPVVVKAGPKGTKPQYSKRYTIRDMTSHISLALALLGPPLAVLVSALPLAASFAHHLVRRDVSDYACFNASLPNITIYATGGTIAGSAVSDTQTAGYTAGSLGVGTLIEAVPSLCNISNVRGVQIVNTGSSNITPNNLLNISQAIQADFDSGLTQGAIVTHGTDTLEESAFFLDLTVRSEEPIVMVGAMRPATAISADGPMNLLAAVTLAASPQARGRGTMIVLNDRIASARYTTKAHANSLDTFKAEEQGYLGAFQNVQPVFYYPPSRPLGHVWFNVSGIPVDDGLPDVDVLYGHQSLQSGLFKSAVDSGAKGIVLAGMGAGSWPREARRELQETAAQTGIPVVVSRRTAWGFVHGNRNQSIGGGFLNPQKCRIQLQLAIQAGYSFDQIKSIFEYHDFS